MRALTPAQMREVDRATIEDIGIPGVVLMERAACGALEVLLRRAPLSPGDTVGVLCGGGNNGGDGFAMARMLHLKGWDVWVGALVPIGDLKGDAKLNADILARLDVEITPVDAQTRWGDLPKCAAWCDALLGTGLDRPVTGVWADAIEFLNEQPWVLAVDIPSGVHGETGQVMGVAVQATACAALALPKIGQLVSPGRHRCGDIEIVDIGIPDGVINKTDNDSLPNQIIWLTRTFALEHLPRPTPDAHKGQAGRVVVMAGSLDMAGAAMMTSRAVIESGAGLVSVATHEDVIARIHVHCPEIMAKEDTLHNLKSLTPDADCVGVGPGLGQDARAQRLVDFALTQTSCPLVLDADALNIAAKHGAQALAQAATGRPVVLTPHPGEMARLCGTSIQDILSDPVAHARQLAAQTQCVVVLKISTTLVVSPKGHVHINSTGNPGMATAGMGDTLTGILCAMLARTPQDPMKAASLAVWLHGRAADAARLRFGALGITATRTLEALGGVFSQLEVSS